MVYLCTSISFSIFLCCCYFIFLLSLLLLLISFLSFQKILHTHTHNLSRWICRFVYLLTINFYHSNVFTSFSIKYFHRCIRIRVSIYIYIVYPYSVIHSLLRCSKKGKFATSHIASTNIFTTHIYIHTDRGKKRQLWSAKKHTHTHTHTQR